MAKRKYYSVRTGRHPAGARLSLDKVRELILATFLDFTRREYFQQAFGYDCIDEGQVQGELGSNVEGHFARKLRKQNLWPIGEKIQGYSEDDIFDVIELLYDLISKPVEGRYHNYNNCGYHYYTFDRPAGQREFRDEINEIIEDYGPGYELSSEGDILTLADIGLESLEGAQLPRLDPANVEQRVYAAVHKFRRHRSSLDDRRDAIRALADVLEFLRPRLKRALSSKDESDLFNIANNFAIRHHDDRQKANYDKSIWYSWLFYYYLATVHAAVRLIEKQDAQTQNTSTAGG